MEAILDKVEEEWIAKTIGTPPPPSEEASWSTPQMQDNAFGSEEYDADDEDKNLTWITSKYTAIEGVPEFIYLSTIIILLSCMYFTAIGVQQQNPAHLKYMKCGTWRLNQIS